MSTVAAVAEEVARVSRVLVSTTDVMTAISTRRRFRLVGRMILLQERIDAMVRS
ncbi:hypothetical protein [Streptosporangium longisporum]|uniref:hypothetical protein n=1 Tax=Streptosporangium longisporum TaxID=46187 RepID=UPI0031E92F35